MKHLARWMMLCAVVGAAGCASPGPPRAPSLQLPTVVTDLTAQREGDLVRLRFTAPTRATDRMALKGGMSAELCRQTAGMGACVALPRTVIAEQRSSNDIVLEDRLPSVLSAGTASLLSYRVQLFNSKGRSAGYSAVAWTAAGAAPAQVMELTAVASQQGAVLRWQKSDGRDTVEIERVHVQGAVTTKAPVRVVGLPAETEPEQETMSVVEQAGGAVDATAQFGQSYRYSAARVRRVTIAGHAAELRSAPSAVVTLEMRDTFPPKTPGGLIAVPGTGGIDLSWEANVEPDLAGYFVYRVAVGAGSTPLRLTAAALDAPAYHDAEARSGQRYRYSVSAMDQSGNESPRSVEVEEGIQ